MQRDALCRISTTAESWRWGAREGVSERTIVGDMSMGGDISYRKQRNGWRLYGVDAGRTVCRSGKDGGL